MAVAYSNILRPKIILFKAILQVQVQELTYNSLQFMDMQLRSSCIESCIFYITLKLAINQLINHIILPKQHTKLNPGRGGVSLVKFFFLLKIYFFQECTKYTSCYFCRLQV